MADNIKFVLVVLILGGAMGGFYYYGDQSLLVRVIALVAAAGISAAIFFQTAPGRQLWGFFGDAKMEVRKVVWPTRKETVQTTLVVVAMVIVVAMILWVFDLFLTWAVRLLTGQ
ncbi:MAG TPA: preprotein translocase subunit SecE [Gammaproteobacteria bacterium]|nr:preprotein translocase subunit SecE [Gammaproteobacteria bacterium]